MQEITQQDIGSNKKATIVNNEEASGIAQATAEYEAAQQAAQAAIGDASNAAIAAAAAAATFESAAPIYEPPVEAYVEPSTEQTNPQADFIAADVAPASGLTLEQQQLIDYYLTDYWLLGV